MIIASIVEEIGRIINEIELAILKGLKDLGLLDSEEIDDAITELGKNQDQ